MNANEIARAVVAYKWAGYNGGQATKLDLLDVCDFIATMLKGQTYRHDKTMTVAQLRSTMRALLVVLREQVEANRIPVKP